MNFDYAAEFKKELKRLSKKWRSLPSDIDYIKPLIESLYISEDPQELSAFRDAFFNGKRAAILQIKDDAEVVKMRLDVESLSTNNNVRIIFKAVIVTHTVTFIEIFAKNEKSREDTQRIKRYLP
jgi:hypothetical protein